MGKRNGTCRDSGSRNVRVSCRVSVEEWRLLGRLAERGGFKTVSGLLRDLIWHYSCHVIRMASERKSRDIGAEIREMFRSYEDTGMDWCDDVNKRR